MLEFLKPIFEPFTLIIIIAIILLAFIKRDKNLVTLLGIGGTFIGIVIGLHELDTGNISESIPKLLSGLFMAFYTSIAGVIASVILTFFEGKEDKKNEKDILLDISSKLSNLVENKNESNKSLLDIKNELLNLNKNIGGDGESSLLTQIQKLRTTFSDKQDVLNKNIKDGNNNIIKSGNENHEKFQKSFDEFASKMADQNINALTEAIEKVMGEFNTTINEKLGKVFEDFKESVNNLNIWQAEYKEHIIDNTNTLSKVNESLEKTSKAFEITVEKSEKFSGISEALGKELISLNDSLEILKSGLKEFEGIANNNKESSEKIIESIENLKENFVGKAEIMISESETHIKNMKEAFESQSKDLVESHNNILNDLKNNVDNTSNKLKEYFENTSKDLSEKTLSISKESEGHIKNMKESFESQSKDLVESHNNILNDLKNNVDNTNKNVSEQFERIANELERQVVTLDNNLREHYEEFNQQLQTELGNSLKEFDRAIVTVYKNFIEELNSLNSNK